MLSKTLLKKLALLNVTFGCKNTSATLDACEEQVFVNAMKLHNQTRLNKNDVGLFIFGLGLYIEWLVAMSIINAPFLQLNCLTFD